MPGHAHAARGAEEDANLAAEAEHVGVQSDILAVQLADLDASRIQADA